MCDVTAPSTDQDIRTWIISHVSELTFNLILSLLLSNLSNLDLEDERVTHIVKVKMRRNPSSAESETYNINMNTFYDGQPGEFLALLNSFSIAIDGTGTTIPSVRINYLRTMLREQALR